MANHRPFPRSELCCNGPHDQSELQPHPQPQVWGFAILASCPKKSTKSSLTIHIFINKHMPVLQLNGTFKSV